MHITKWKKPIWKDFMLCYSKCISSVQFSRSVVSNSLRPHESQHARPPCPSPTPRVRSDSHPSSQWCHPAISSSVIPFSSCPQSLPASESFPMSQRLAWGGQSTCKIQKYGKLKRSMVARSWGKGRNRGSQRIFRPHRVFHMIHYWWIFATCLSKHIECTSSEKPNVNYRLWVIVMGSLTVINIQYIK